MAGPSGTTPKLALPYPIGGDTVNVPRDVQALATSLDRSSFVFSGTIAARPSATTVPDGARYYATDTAVESITFGDVWYAIAPADGSVTTAKIVDGAVTPAKTSGGVIPPLVSSLPGSPVDGQEVFYLADATTGAVWHLRYRAASSSPYKWELVGGSELVSVATGSSPTTGTGASWSPVLSDGNGTTRVVPPLSGDYDVRWGVTAVASAGSNTGVGAARSTDANPTTDCLVNFGLSAASVNFQGNGNGRVFAASAGTAILMFYLYTGTVVTFFNRRLYIRPIRVG
jgi:hypothetical protein